MPDPAESCRLKVGIFAGTELGAPGTPRGEALGSERLFHSLHLLGGKLLVTQSPL